MVKITIIPTNEQKLSPLEQFFIRRPHTVSTMRERRVNKLDQKEVANLGKRGYLKKEVKLGTCTIWTSRSESLLWAGLLVLVEQVLQSV